MFVGIALSLVSHRGLRGFSPASLFANSEEGVWYEPSDLTTLFRDTAGTLPATTPGDAVALMLDKSQGAPALGPELVTNGDFSDGGTGFTFGANTTFSGGVANFNYTSFAGMLVSVGCSVVAGRTYRVSFDLVSRSAGSIRPIIGNTTQSTTISLGTQVYLIVAAATVPNGLTFVGAGDGFIGSIDNISVRELPGNHAVQSILASRPIYQTSPDRLTLDKVDDVMLVTLPAITGTMVLATPEGTAAYGFNRAAGSYDIGGRGGDYFPGSAITGQIIRDGAMSEGDVTKTIAYLRDNGGGDNYGAVTNFTNFWRGWSELTSFPLIDTSSGTNFTNAWQSCSSLTSFPLIDTSSGIVFNSAWRTCSSLTSFPLIDTSSGTNFFGAWLGCSSLTSFPLIDTSSGTSFSSAWLGCASLTSFPLIDTSSGTNFVGAWESCPSLTSFPLIDTSSGTNFTNTWRACSSLASFPLIDTSSGTNFTSAWFGCSSLTSFPLIDTSSGTNFTSAWLGCSSLTSFPLIDTSSGTGFASAWQSCSSLTSFPLIDTSSGTSFVGAWQSCSSLTSFPANAFDTCPATNFTNAFVNTALSQTSIDNILVSINTAGTSSGTFNQSGGSAPSATGEAAIDALRARGWTVTVTGGY